MVDEREVPRPPAPQSRVPLQRDPSDGVSPAQARVDALMKLLRATRASKCPRTR